MAVDDEPMALEKLESYIRRVPFLELVALCEDPLEAVQMMMELPVDALFMDINMPVMNGYEAAAEIRKFAAEIPIVAVTAYAYASDEQKIMQNGFTGYMPKPINAPRLKKQILDILRERITLI